MWIRLLPAISWTIIIMALCWLPEGWLHGGGGQGPEIKIPYLDKMIHAAIFFGFAVLWSGAIGDKRRFLWIGLGGLALALVTELVQNLPMIARHGNLKDGAADVAGLALGLVFSYFVEERFARGDYTRRARSIDDREGCFFRLDSFKPRWGGGNQHCRNRTFPPGRK